MMTKQQKQEIALFYQRHSQRATCRKYSISAQQARDIVDEVYENLKSAKDQIEQKHTPPEIREMYGKYLVGRGIKAEFEDIPTHCQLAPFEQKNGQYVIHIDLMVYELSQVWGRFKTCHTMQPMVRLQIAA